MCSELPPLFDAVLVPVEMLPKHTLDIARDAGASQADPADYEVQPLLGLVGDIDRLRWLMRAGWRYVSRNAAKSSFWLLAFRGAAAGGEVAITSSFGLSAFVRG